MSSRFLLPFGFVSLRPDFGDRVRQHRRGWRMKQQVLADAIGIARETLSRIESGRTEPRPDTLEALVYELNMSWNDVAVVGEGPSRSRRYDASRRGAFREGMGRNVRLGRLRKGLSLRVVAERVGISASQLSRIERGAGDRSSLFEERDEDASLARSERRVRLTHPLLRELAGLGSMPGEG